MISLRVTGTWRGGSAMKLECLVDVGGTTFSCDNPFHKGWDGKPPTRTSNQALVQKVYIIYVNAYKYVYMYICMCIYIYTYM